MGLRGRQCIERSFARERQIEDVLSLYAQRCAAQLPASEILDH
jgi:hypothetical protein